MNLQYGDCRNDLSEIQEQYGITVHDWPDSDPLHDLDGFAAKIAALDLVISVDNSTVHLAGALGRPVWVLQPYSADWRWGVAQAGSLWYPSLKNFHQPNPADWKTVLETVQTELDHLIQQYHST